MKNKINRTAAVFISGAVLLCAVFLLNICLGSVKISLSDVAGCIASTENAERTTRTIVMNIRLPRTIAAAVGGASLAAAGVLMQVFFGNPIVEPYILGISSGSNLFLGIVMLGGYSFGLSRISSLGLVGGAFLGAMAVMMIVVFASQKVRSITTLLIIGLMTGYVCSAATSVLTVMADKEKLAGFTLRTMGSFSGFTWEQAKILCALSIPFMAAAFLMSKQLNAMLFGEKYALTLGVSIKKFRVLIVIISSVLTAAVTAFAGAVSFVGLAVPHIVRMLLGTSDCRLVIPASCLFGALMTCLCDMGARLIMSPSELPLGAMTAVIGAPVAVYLLVRKNGAEV